MRYYHYRIFQLLKLLCRTEKPLSGREICTKLAIQPRTLRDDISRYKEDLAADGVDLISQNGVGYQIKVRDKEKYHLLINEMIKMEHRQHCITPVRHAERVSYIMRTLLATGHYLKLDEVADELYISRSTLNNCMREVRQAIASFNLTLIAKPGCGIKIAGNELSIRQAIARYFFYDDSQQFFQEEKGKVSRRKISNILIETLKENNLQLTDTGFQNLVIHLEIALMRIDKTHYPQALPADYIPLKKRDEYRVALQLVDKIEQAFSVSFPETECCFIAIHLAGKRYLLQQEATASRPDIMQLFDKILYKINGVFGIDLTEDLELCQLLSLHFIPMMDRLNWNLTIHNPLLQQIKEENVTAYEIAVLAGKIIHQETGLAVSEAETGYLAVHFALAIDRRGRPVKRYNIIVVCASGMGSSQLLLYKIRQRFAHHIDQVKVVQLYELNQFEQQDYDLILSTVDVPFQTAIPSLRINYFLEPDDLNQMASWLQSKPQKRQRIEYFYETLFFTDLHATDRFGLIEELCHRVSSVMPVDDDFTQSVIEREKISATEFGNGVAFPHPEHPGGEKTFVAVAVLPNPVRWDKQEVRYLFMLNISYQENDALQLLYESLFSLMSDKSKLKHLTKNTNFLTFITLLHEIADHKETSSESAFK